VSTTERKKIKNLRVIETKKVVRKMGGGSSRMAASKEMGWTIPLSEVRDSVPRQMGGEEIRSKRISKTLKGPPESYLFRKADR